VHRYGVEHAFDRAFAAHLADLGLRVTHALEELEYMPVRAPVLVNWH
jgi:hypothetical protein